MSSKVPPRVCTMALQGRTEFTPRYDPARTSLRSLFKVNASPMEVKPAVYDPPDVFNHHLHPPEGALDVLQIVENGVEFASNLGRILDSPSGITGYPEF